MQIKFLFVCNKCYMCVASIILFTYWSMSCLFYNLQMRKQSRQKSTVSKVNNFSNRWCLESSTRKGNHLTFAHCLHIVNIQISALSVGAISGIYFRPMTAWEISSYKKNISKYHNNSVNELYYIFCKHIRILRDHVQSLKQFRTKTL